MNAHRVVITGLVLLVVLFTAACGAGITTPEPPLPWEVTQDAGGNPPPTETIALLPDQVAPSPTYTEAAAESTPSYTSTVVTATANFTATFTQPAYTATYTPPALTATYTLSPTNTQPAFTPTFTYTPSPSPTATRAAQIAPPDNNFNSPLNIPLDSTVSVTDFVSFPDGDTTDRVRYDITGMNQNSSLSGGRANLTITASCFGTGTQYVRFLVGGQTFSCGQTLVSKEVVYDTRTGTITIEAFGGVGTYVQWVLSGTATRVQ